MRQSCAKWLLDNIKYYQQAKCPETSASHVGDKLMVLETVDDVPGKADANNLVRTLWRHKAVDLNNLNNLNQRVEPCKLY